jgi:hypothetical protein
MLPGYNSQADPGARTEVSSMIGPEAIVNQVWQGIVPADWRIVRGKRRSAFAAGVSAAAVTFAGMALFTMLIGVFASGPGKIAGYPALIVVGVAVAALALLAGIVVTVTAAIRNAGDPDPLIVLLSNGFVEYVSRHKPIIGILYAELATVDLRIRGQTQTWRNQAAGQYQSAARKKVWLDLLYHDGQRERWTPRANFGPRLAICQAISKAHALYDVLYGSGR